MVMTHSPRAATMPKPKNTIASSSHTYIVQANHLAKPPQFDTLDRWYASMVMTHSPRAATNSSSRIMYTYDTVMHGFAVGLTRDEARALTRIHGVLAVHQERVSLTQTTWSPTFLGLGPASGAWPQSGFGDGVIIGFVDSGISPAHPSFNDAGLGPVRPSWRRKCATDGTISCNRKVVGAASFVYGADGRLLSPVDTDGHGTHVASTAAGSDVPGASFEGFAKGMTTGVAPKARVAVNRACDVGCPDSALVAAIDAATRDAVDVLCVALGKEGTARPLHDDVVAIALFRAELRGIVVVVPGGNSGPRPSTVSNVAPWVTTVGAATVDRVFPAKLNLGNGLVLIGQSLYSVRADGRRSVALVKSNCSEPEDLTPDKVMGGIVVCRELSGELVAAARASRAGAAGLVAVDGLERFASAVPSLPFSLPGVVLAYTEAKMLEAYMASTAYPTASLTFACDTATGDSRAPIVAGFSSRGPAQEVEGIVKPDLVAPAVNILAAWPALPDGKDFKTMSGTSVASAHVAGVAALIKHQHADWTPAMVRSAMMTSTRTTDNDSNDILDSGVDVSQGNGTAATPLVAGAGLVNP
uniref:Subtilisin-like protease n=1 Tax=Hordeum vulgare subsp. vulgare TaxID=112509 RepID=A0A8I6YQQ1_HORVV